ncbi:cellulose-growth-specific protein [Ephemerocybe angulata]|uniref:AA9 family lytic polysaccharide monooxygenase n=1 Tax=Ephemerocybe angulata TaxID=980116 RepID=A0A8H6HL74_9AGAR|nr:cellulose-growth-specific protein [Tulosesus angulatus]
MVSPLTLLLLAPFLVVRVVAHGALASYIINDEEYIGYQPYSPPADQATIARPFPGIDPIRDPSSENLSCNNDGGPVGDGGRQLSAPIHPGDVITGVYGLWLHPFGPALVYMARCPGACVDSNSRDLKWFKIKEEGLIDGSIVYGNWGNGVVSKTGMYNATIPSYLEAGEYLIRHELISLHAIENGPQIYVECAQLNVLPRAGDSGKGRLPPSRYMVSFPGAYRPSDPGLLVNPFAPGGDEIMTYDIPGPAVWDGKDEESYGEALSALSNW